MATAGEVSIGVRFRQSKSAFHCDLCMYGSRSAHCPVVFDPAWVNNKKNNSKLPSAPEKVIYFAVGCSAITASVINEMGALSKITEPRPSTNTPSTLSLRT